MTVAFSISMVSWTFPTPTSHDWNSEKKEGTPRHGFGERYKRVPDGAETPTGQAGFRIPNVNVFFGSVWRKPVGSTRWRGPDRRIERTVGIGRESVISDHVNGRTSCLRMWRAIEVIQTGAANPEQQPNAV